VARLLPPLLFAMFVIVPPQSYYQVVEYIAGHPGTSLSVDHFWLRYVTASGHWCSPDGCLITPTYNHMWFVAYLFIYTLVLAALLLVWRRLGEHIQAGVERAFKGLGLFAGRSCSWACCAARSTSVTARPMPWSATIMCTPCRCRPSCSASAWPSRRCCASA
jgi:hypothetical protein